MQNLKPLRRHSPARHHRPVSNIIPNQWQGETGTIGPFSSCTVAEYFTHAVVECWQYQSFQHHIFAKGDSWYVQVNKHPPLTSAKVSTN